MITIRTPEKYINSAYILKSSGEHIAKLGNKALIVGGKTALSSIGEDFFTSLKASSIGYEVEEFIGYCTTENIEKYTELVKELEVDIVIGVGGGRVLDTIKAVGERTNTAVVTVPTIAATCAAWSALSVVYDENGTHSHYITLEASPRLVLIDTSIISSAPARYINAGIGDTIVKWYEAAPHALEGQDDISLQIGLGTSKLALDILNQSGISVSEQAGNKVVTTDLRNVIDSIIILAGLVGSINGGNHRGAIAHPLHDSFTLLPDTHESLHGEKVIFGLIVQFILEKKPKNEIEKLIDFLNKLKLPVTLEQLGIKEDVNDKVSIVAKGVNIIERGLNKLSFEVNSELIAEAILEADKLGKQSLGRVYSV